MILSRYYSSEEGVEWKETIGCMRTEKKGIMYAKNDRHQGEPDAPYSTSRMMRA